MLGALDDVRARARHIHHAHDEGANVITLRFAPHEEPFGSLHHSTHPNTNGNAAIIGQLPSPSLRHARGRARATPRAVIGDQHDARAVRDPPTIVHGAMAEAASHSLGNWGRCGQHGASPLTASCPTTAVIERGSLISRVCWRDEGPNRRFGGGRKG
jgi:hypothetical protein